MLSLMKNPSFNPIVLDILLSHFVNYTDQNPELLGFYISKMTNLLCSDTFKIVSIEKKRTQKISLIDNSLICTIDIQNSEEIKVVMYCDEDLIDSVDFSSPVRDIIFSYFTNLFTRCNAEVIRIANIEAYFNAFSNDILHLDFKLMDVLYDPKQELYTGDFYKGEENVEE